MGGGRSPSSTVGEGSSLQTHSCYPLKKEGLCWGGGTGLSPNAQKMGCAGGHTNLSLFLKKYCAGGDTSTSRPKKAVLGSGGTQVYPSSQRRAVLGWTSLPPLPKKGCAGGGHT